MSLINDMLRDLDARKASDDPLTQPEERLGHHIEELRHTDVTPPLEKRVQAHLGWLFWLFLVGLLVVSTALYLSRSPESDSEFVSPIGAEGASSTASPKIETVSEHLVSAPAPLAPSTDSSLKAEQDIPRLLALSAVEKGSTLHLSLGFSTPLQGPARLSRDGERVELVLPGVRDFPADRPHAALREWLSQDTGGSWKIQFNWPKDADVQLNFRQDTEGLARWELLLAMPETREQKTPSNQMVPRASTEAPKQPPLPTPRAPVQDKPEKKPVAGLTPSQQAEALYAEAWQLQQKGKIELAMEKLRQAVHVLPEHVRARELLVRLLLRAGQPRAAEIELLRGLEIQPRQPELVELMARMLADQGRGQDALMLLQGRMQMDRLSHQALYAVLAARVGEHAKAAEAYQRASELEPRDPRWRLGRAIALENSGQPSAARAAYAQALALEGLDPASRTFAQERLQQLGQGD